MRKMDFFIKGSTFYNRHILHRRLMLLIYFPIQHKYSTFNYQQDDQEIKEDKLISRIASDIELDELNK